MRSFPWAAAANHGRRITTAQVVCGVFISWSWWTVAVNDVLYCIVREARNATAELSFSWTSLPHERRFTVLWSRRAGTLTKVTKFFRQVLHVINCIMSNTCTTCEKNNNQNTWNSDVLGVVYVNCIGNTSQLKSNK